MGRERMTFQDVLREERIAIGKDETGTRDLVGLAFSGGGIRSATFNLGVIQGLAKLRLLSVFDYLSTVSGGGYIGAWFSAWLKHRFEGNVEAMQDELRRKREPNTPPEPPAIWWLRRYSNYLTPKKGLSGDTLAALAEYLRNLLINQIGLIALFSVLLLVPQSLRRLIDLLHAVPGGLPRIGELPLAPFALAGVLMLAAVAFIALNLLQDYGRNDRPETGADQPDRNQCRLLGAPGVFLSILLPAAAASLALSYGLYATRADPAGGIGGRGDLWRWLLGGALGYALVWVLAWLLAVPIARAIAYRWANCGRIAVRGDLPHLALAQIGLFCLLAGSFAGWLLYQFTGFLDALSEHEAANWAFGYGVPLLLLGFWLTVVAQLGLSARLIGGMQLEWWTRLGGLLLLLTAAWAGLHAIILYAPPAVAYAREWAVAGGAAWLVSTIAGVLLGKGTATAGKGQKVLAETITRIAPWVFVLGLLVLLSWGWNSLLLHIEGLHDAPLFGSRAVGFQGFTTRQQRLTEMVQTSTLLYATGGTFLVWLLLLWRLDINLFSLHHFYRNRLTRCYLGAARYRDVPSRGGRSDRDTRSPHPFTGFDPEDDFALAKLADERCHVKRPYLIVNTAMNLVGGSNLAWQTRKAAAFFMSPLYCGFELIYHGRRGGDPGGNPKTQEGSHGNRVCAFVPTRRYMEGVPLGTAMAISGAAVSPNMGYHSSPAVGFLLTVFNVRLGHWCGNPYRPGEHLTRRSPAFGGWYLLMELLGMTRNDGRYVYLSDGGHFENLGVYELVRRRCRCIVAVDAGQDPETGFDDLANLIRKCYTDFGAVIEIDVSRLCRDPDLISHYPSPSGWSHAFAALGTIDYGGGEQGLLLYVKPGLRGDEPPDVLNYRTAHEEFPHESTGDQFFDENQFEAYRKLGRHIVLELFWPALKRMRLDPDELGLPPERFKELLQTVGDTLDCRTQATREERHAL